MQHMWKLYYKKTRLFFRPFYTKMVWKGENITTWKFELSNLWLYHPSKSCILDSSANLKFKAFIVQLSLIKNSIKAELIWAHHSWAELVAVLLQYHYNLNFEKDSSKNRYFIIYNMCLLMYYNSWFIAHVLVNENS